MVVLEEDNDIGRSEEVYISGSKPSKDRNENFPVNSVAILRQGSFRKR